MSRGIFVVLEGLDGSGGETQSKLLGQFLSQKGIGFENVRYPDYEGYIGKLVHEFLHKKIDLPVDVEFSLFVTDFLKDREKIEKALNEGKVVVADRYITSTLAYQTLKGFPLEKGLSLAELFGLPKPDLVIFIDISPETSIQRKLKEKNNLDRHEEDKNYLGKVKTSYENLIKENVFAREWVVVDGERPIEEVANQVRDIILKKL